MRDVKRELSFGSTTEHDHQRHRLGKDALEAGDVPVLLAVPGVRRLVYRRLVAGGWAPMLWRLQEQVS